MHLGKRKYFKLSDTNKEALEIMLMQSTHLATAYYLKEQFFDIMNSKDSNEAKIKLRNFVLAATASELKEFQACLTMLSNWSKYILNSFDCPYSNGFTE